MDRAGGLWLDATMARKRFRKKEDLEGSAEVLLAQRRLNEAVDNALEVALRERIALNKTMAAVLPLLGEHLKCTTALLRTFNEDLEMESFGWSEEEGQELPVPIEKILEKTDANEPFFEATKKWSVIGQRVDVAGENFGAAAIGYPRKVSEEEHLVVSSLLNIWCEEVDNYLGGIAVARRKHHLVNALSEALRDPVLDTGVNRAIDVIQNNIGFADMVLVFRHDDSQRDATFSYKVIRDGELLLDSANPTNDSLHEFMREHGLELLDGDTAGITDRLRIKAFREEVMITGVVNSHVVGRAIISRGHGDFDTFDRDLLDRFADFLRQRIVDFNREWKSLSLCFPRDVVQRLLAEEDYVEKYLVPREREVAIFYCDISGFTRVSEQILKEPPLIGKLINTWSARVVEIIWESGGVFDKMVGDCIIGLWGPPFFDLGPTEACRQAARAALRIRDYTQSLASSGELPELKEAGVEMGVATGLNFCPLFVGRFGPNEDFTGFSSGMNNTARLQGVAERDEILCMSSFVDVLGERAKFDEEREAQVKNVADPLKFRPLTGLEE